MWLKVEVCKPWGIPVKVLPTGLKSNFLIRSFVDFRVISDIVYHQLHRYDSSVCLKELMCNFPSGVPPGTLSL